MCLVFVIWVGFGLVWCGYDFDVVWMYWVVKERKWLIV